MATVIVKENVRMVAETAAELAIQNLSAAITAYGQAVWVLAGGTAPMSAYRVLAEQYADEIDWSKVFFALGDERCVPIGHPDANWTQIRLVLLNKIATLTDNQLRPPTELGAEAAAKAYASTLSELAQKEADLPRLNYVWLGMGEDGHTLSLFPDYPSLAPTEALVIAVHDSPKPPPERISLTLRALEGTENCLIMVTGAGKAEIVVRAQAGDTALPIVQVVKTIEAAGGTVTWLLDSTAASLV